LSDAGLRVRTLRLRAPDDALVRRGRMLIEDALQTASLPSSSAGRLLIVRSLELGRFPGQASPAMLAQRVEERMLELAGRAVHAESSAAAAAPAVFFHDAIEPFICLAVRLALGQETRAWFWRSAVRGWHPTGDRDEGLRLILHEVLQRPAGVVAAGSLIATLDGRGALEALLGTLRGQDGPALLRASGWSMPGESLTPIDAAAGTNRLAPPPARVVLDSWSARWGREDARSLWLAATLLVSEKPARLLQPDLLQRAGRLLARQTTELQRRVPSPPTPQIRGWLSIHSPPAAAFAKATSAGDRPDGRWRQLPNLPNTSSAHPAQPQPNRHVQPWLAGSCSSYRC
jgi:hypothetical protein